MSTGWRITEVKGNRRVKLDAVYLGKEITVGGNTVIRDPHGGMRVRRILESAPCTMYSCAEDFGIMDHFIPSITS